MLARKIILGFGFAAVLPLLVHYGIEAFLFIGAPLGIAVTVAGSLVGAPAIGGGLMLGGIFTFTEGCFYRWGDLEPVGRFLVLLVAFAVLLWIGYQRLHELTGARHAA